MAEGTKSPATGEGHAAPTLRICKSCRYLRQREPTRLFNATELQSPGGLKAYSEWQQQDKQHAEREAQLVASGSPFTYEPHHYAWCAAFTPLELVAKANSGDDGAITELMRAGGASINPVSGAVTPIYALCLRLNPRGDCQKHEPR
jgi:hypothetical protein